MWFRCVQILRLQWSSCFVAVVSLYKQIPDTSQEREGLAVGSLRVWLVFFRKPATNPGHRHVSAQLLYFRACSDQKFRPYSTCGCKYGISRNTNFRANTVDCSAAPYLRKYAPRYFRKYGQYMYSANTALSCICTTPALTTLSFYTPQFIFSLEYVTSKPLYTLVNMILAFF